MSIANESKQRNDVASECSIGSADSNSDGEYVLPNGRQLLGSPVSLGKRDDKQLLSIREDPANPNWLDAKTNMKGYYGRRFRRYLRFQSIRDGRLEKIKKLHGDYQKASLSLEKGTQTDAYVVMDTSLFLLQAGIPAVGNANWSNSGDQLSSIFSSTTADTSLASLLPTAPFENLSPSLLPPVTPCLGRVCKFAEKLRKESNPVWLGCTYKIRETGKNCNYWVHAKCYGFPKMSQHVVKLSKGFRCPQHLE